MKSFSFSLATLVMIIIPVCLYVLIYKHITADKTEKEKDAIKKGFLTYLLTDSALFGWLVYKRNNPNDKKD